MIEANIRMGNMGFYAMGDNTIPDFVCSTIELSTHTNPCDNLQQQELLDCDLAILGAPPLVYFEYVHNVRSEYGVVPQDVWNIKRSEFLNYMLDKPQIFQHPFYRDKYEASARTNMESEYILLSNVI